MGTFKINGELELNSYLTAATTLYVSSADNKSIIFKHGSTEYVRINPSGCLNIGSTQTASTYKLYVAGKSWLSDTLYFNSTASYINASDYTGNAATATKLTTATAGDSNTPVYFTGGKPAACTSLDLNTTGNAATATLSTYLATSAASDNASRHVYFAYNGDAVGKQRVVIDDNFKYNPSTNILYTGGLSTSGQNVTVANGNINISRTTTIANNTAATINFTITQSDNNVSSTSYIAVYDDLDTAGNGNNMVICSKSGTYLCAGEGAGNYLANNPSTSEHVHICADSAIYFHTNCNTVANATKSCYISTSGVLYGAAWNDYAEFRNQDEIIESGYCVTCDKSGKVRKTEYRMQYCEGIVSDTFGFAIGENDENKTPLAVSGRVLAFYNNTINDYEIGDPVCAGANGKIEKMTRQEVKDYPDRMIGTVSEIPTYETWGQGNVKVNGRIWIKVK